MKKICKYALIAALSISLSNCANGDDYGTPNLNADCVTLVPTVTINDLSNAPVGDIVNVTTDEIFEGYVVSSDEGGNFYKAVSIVSTDNTKAISISLDSYNLYNRFEPGRKVYVNLNGLDYQNANTYTVGLNVGKQYEASNGLRIGRIDNVYIDDAVKVSCDKVNEDQLVKHLTIAQAKSDQYLNQLIEIDGAQFTDASLGHNYYSEGLLAYATATAVDHIVTDSDGSTMIVRVSSYVNFGHLPIPTGNGKIRGVMTKYNSTYQFMIRTQDDVQFDGTRLNPSIENFESYTQNANTFDAYQNIKVLGTNDWYVGSYNGNKYIQARKGNNSTATKIFFVMPYDFNTYTRVSFQSLFGYMSQVTGPIMKVYYSTNFDANNPTANLVDITNSFTYSDHTGTGWATAFTNSGTHTFTGMSGQGHIILAYDVATTSNSTAESRPGIQLDNIKFE